MKKEENRTVPFPLEEFKEKLIKRLGGQLILIRLYGSKAAGTSHKESDIDFLIVVRRKKRFFDEIDGIVTELELEAMNNHGVYISSVIYGLEEYTYLNSIPTNFMYWVQKEGIDLWKEKVHAA